MAKDSELAEMRTPTLLSAGPGQSTTKPNDDPIDPTMASLVYGNGPKEQNWRAMALHRSGGRLEYANDGNKFMTHVDAAAKASGETPAAFIRRVSSENFGDAVSGQTPAPTPDTGPSGLESLFGALKGAAVGGADMIDTGVRKLRRFGRDVNQAVLGTRRNLGASETQQLDPDEREGR